MDSGPRARAAASVRRRVCGHLARGRDRASDRPRSVAELQVEPAGAGRLDRDQRARIVSASV
eukprot:911081-Rhodomonas_salina.1